jgi:hypothetical protein
VRAWVISVLPGDSSSRRSSRRNRARPRLISSASAFGRATRAGHRRRTGRTAACDSRDHEDPGWAGRAAAGKAPAFARTRGARRSPARSPAAAGYRPVPGTSPAPVWPYPDHVGQVERSPCHRASSSSRTGRRMPLFDGQVHRDTHMGELCDRICVHQALFTGSDMGHIRQRTRFMSRNRTRTDKARGLPRTGNQDGRVLCSDSEALRSAPPVS